MSGLQAGVAIGVCAPDADVDDRCGCGVVGAWRRVRRRRVTPGRGRQRSRTPATVAVAAPLAGRQGARHQRREQQQRQSRPTVEIYDPTTNSWTAAAPIPDALATRRWRRRCRAARCSSPADMTAPATSRPTVRSTIRARTRGQRRHRSRTPALSWRWRRPLAGRQGARHQRHPTAPCNSTADSEIYDPTTDSWSAAAPIPNARCYAVGGSVAGRQGARHQRIRRPAASRPTVRSTIRRTDSWSAAAPIPDARYAAVAAPLPGGKVLVTSGNDKQRTSRPTVRSTIRPLTRGRRRHRSRTPATRRWRRHCRAARCSSPAETRAISGPIGRQ